MQTENSFDSGYDSPVSDTASGMKENSNVESPSMLTTSASTSTPADSKGPPPPPPPPPPSEENITVARLVQVVEHIEKSQLPEEGKQLIVKGLRSIINDLKQFGLEENDQVPQHIVDALKNLNLLSSSTASGVISVSASKQSSLLMKNLFSGQSFIENIQAEKNKLKKVDGSKENNQNVKNSKENKQDVRNPEFADELAKTLSRRGKKQDVAQDQANEDLKKKSSTVTYLLSKQDIQILKNIIKILCLKDNSFFYSSFEDEYNELLKIDTLGYEESHKFLTEISKEATSFLVSEMSKKEKIQRKDYMDLWRVMEPVIRTEKNREFFDVKAILHERKEKAESANKNYYFLISLKDKKIQEPTKVVEGKMSQMNLLSPMESAQQDVVKLQGEGKITENEALATTNLSVDVSQNSTKMKIQGPMQKDIVEPKKIEGEAYKNTLGFTTGASLADSRVVKNETADSSKNTDVLSKEASRERFCNIQKMWRVAEGESKSEGNQLSKNPNRITNA